MQNNFQRSCCNGINQRNSFENSNQHQQTSYRNISTSDNCGCNSSPHEHTHNQSFKEILYSGVFPLGIGYTPWQKCDCNMENEIYDLRKAFKAGTIFPDLDKPFLGRRICS